MAIDTIQDAIKHSTKRQQSVEKARRYYERNRDKIRERAKTWYRQNKIHAASSRAQYYHENKIALIPRMKYWTETHREQSNKIKAASYTRNRKEINFAKQKTVMFYRLTLLNILGGAVCIKCGYAQDWRALCFDHVRDDGKEDRKVHNLSGYAFYRYYVNNPDIARANLQVLCCNCNMIKRYELMGYNKQTYGL